MSKAKKASPVAQPSSRYRFFCWAVAFLSLSQLVVGLDYITLWAGAESQLIWDSQTTSPAFSPLLGILGSIPIDSQFWLVAYRLPSFFFALLGIAFFYVWGAALFGKQAVQVTLLAAAATFLLPLLAKSGALDSWRFGLEIATWIALMRFMKTPNRSWLIWVAALGSLAALIGQWATVVMLLIWQVSYYRLVNPQNETLKKELAKPFVIIFLVFGLSLVAGLIAGGGTSHRPYFYFDFLQLGHLKFFFYGLLGLSPFIGFTLAGLRDLFYKLKRGEELAVLIAVGLFGSLITLSLVFPFLLIFLTAKQLDLYFRAENYPWQNWVKTTQVLHLILVFIAVVLALLGGFFQFQTNGFRALLGCSFAYWMFSFVGVIGLYGFRRDYVLGGMTLAGLLALLFFWIQVYPFFHIQRNWPERTATEIQKLEQTPEVVYISAQETLSLPLAPYLLRNGIAAQVLDSIPAETFHLRLMEPADSLLQPAIKVTGWSWLPPGEVWIGGEK
ncbi:MAG: hypothetical protein AAFO03_17735 [Bacteroidota bacterium]